MRGGWVIFWFKKKKYKNVSCYKSKKIQGKITGFRREARPGGKKGWKGWKEGGGGGVWEEEWIREFGS